MLHLSYQYLTPILVTSSISSTSSYLRTTSSHYTSSHYTSSHLRTGGPVPRSELVWSIQYQLWLLLVRLLLPSQPPLPSLRLLLSSVDKSIPRLDLPRCRRLLHWSGTNRVISLEIKNLFLLSEVHQIHLNINHSRMVLLLLLERRESVSSMTNNLDRNDRDKAVKETKNNTLPTLSC